MKRKILIVDDNEKNIELMQLLLEHAGHTVICAAGGIKGVELARSERPDLIVMDIQMPDLGGINAAREILLDELTHTIPIIGTSAYASPATRQAALRIGMVTFFEKPINREQFVAKIAAILAKHLQEENPPLASNHCRSVK